MIAFDKNEFAVQPLFKLPIPLDAAFIADLKYEISKKKDSS
jgi:hypothetical protein